MHPCQPTAHVGRSRSWYEEKSKGAGKDEEKRDQILVHVAVLDARLTVCQFESQKRTPIPKHFLQIEELLREWRIVWLFVTAGARTMSGNHKLHNRIIQRPATVGRGSEP